MKTLLKFFITYGIYFIFVLLEIGSLILVVNNNHFQRSVFLTSCNSFSATLYKYNHRVIDFFSLIQVNKELAAENVDLRIELVKAQNTLVSLAQDSLSFNSFPSNPEMNYSFYSARVINNSTNKLLNYITLNRGKKDGIEREMSVVNPQGVVGIVKAVSNHFSVVMPLLNSQAQMSCKIKEKHNSSDIIVGAVKDIGSLKWDGLDYRYASLMQVPRHVEISKGDTIVTSGYSDFFPEGILVGTIADFEKSSDDNYYKIKVRLSVNFKTVSYVQVIDYKHRKEQNELELHAEK